MSANFPYFKDFKQVEEYIIEKFERLTNLKINELQDSDLQFHSPKKNPTKTEIILNMSSYRVGIKGILDFGNDFFYPGTKDYKKNYINVIKNKDKPLSDLSHEIIDLCILLNCFCDGYSFDTHKSFEESKYGHLHPNRVRLYFMGFYMDNYASHERYCGHIILDTDDESNTDDDELLDIVKFWDAESDLYKNFLHRTSISKLLQKTDRCDNDETTSGCTSPGGGSTPTEHNDNHGYCWCFFASNCSCGYKSLSIKNKNSEFDDESCLPCYFFTDVLNEMHERFGQFNFGLKSQNMKSLDDLSIFPKEILNIIQFYISIKLDY